MTMTTPAVDQYQLSSEDAKELAGLVVLPHDIRVLLLAAYAKRRGTVALINFFSQAVGLANSVVANNREAIEMFLITEANEHPHAVEKINLPTMFGAANGAAMADEIDQSPLCNGCAFRVGTPANQSANTNCIALECVAFGEDFLCHERLDADGHPHQKCAGFAQRRRTCAPVSFREEPSP